VKQTVLRVPGMHCGGCANRIEEAVKHIEGVRRVKADFQAHTADVAFDSDKVDETKLRFVIEKAGYEVVT
jgi:copper ion binding protein